MSGAITTRAYLVFRIARELGGYDRPRDSTRSRACIPRSADSDTKVFHLLLRVAWSVVGSRIGAVLGESPSSPQSKRRERIVLSTELTEARMKSNDREVTGSCNGDG